MMETCLSYWAMLEASTPIAPDLLTGYAFALAYLLCYVGGQHPSQETAPQAAALQ